MKTIVMTGGGTAGHAVAAQALIPVLKERGWRICYIGSKDGVERELLSGIDGVEYISVSTGRWRRYATLRNLTDPFRVLWGIVQAFWELGRVRPDVIFSGGGFVSVPAVLAGRLRKIPSVIRETDYTLGLANRICQPFANITCVTFYDTREQFPYEKGAYFGELIRPELMDGSRERALRSTGLDGNLPTVLVMGGSLGAASINTALGEALPLFSGKFHVIHLCGKGKRNESFVREGYCQYEYAGEELADFYALADVVVTRCGSNAICEGMLLKKPMVMIPLAGKQSRGDQLQNALYAKRRQCGVILEEEELEGFALYSAVTEVYRDRKNYRGNTVNGNLRETIDKQVACIENVANMRTLDMTALRESGFGFKFLRERGLGS